MNNNEFVFEYDVQKDLFRTFSNRQSSSDLTAPGNIYINEFSKISSKRHKFHPDDEAHITEAIRNGSTDTFVFRYAIDKGIYHEFKYKGASAVSDIHGNVQRYVGIMQDMDCQDDGDIPIDGVNNIDNIPMQKALAEAEHANKAKFEFLSRMSHDIRTPMNAIVGLSNIARMKNDNHEMIDYCLEKINESSRYLLMLINDVLDMSKAESGKIQLNKEAFDCRKFISSIEAIVIQQAYELNIEFATLIDDSVATNYSGDQLRLNQIIINLLSNALNFTSELGHVYFDIRETGRTSDTATVEFTITDTGCGMSEEFQEKMFEPFEQEASTAARNQVGTGLGLSIVKNLVDLMDGKIAVKSRIGIGTRISVSIPLGIIEDDITNDIEDFTVIDSNDTIADFADDSDTFESSSHRILVVEDNQINMDIAKIHLEDAGFHVECAYDGVQAIHMVKCAAPNYYSAVLMDIRMPNMNGLEASKNIRKLDKRNINTLPIIAMTANAFDEDRELAMSSGINGYLIKPVNHLLLIRYLKSVISRHPMQKA